MCSWCQTYPSHENFISQDKRRNLFEFDILRNNDDLLVRYAKLLAEHYNLVYVNISHDVILRLVKMRFLTMDDFTVMIEIDSNYIERIMNNG